MAESTIFPSPIPSGPVVNNGDSLSGFHKHDGPAPANPFQPKPVDVQVKPEAPVDVPAHPEPAKPKVHHWWSGS